MKISGVDVVNWNPRKYRLPGLGIRVGQRKNNFGDLLGPLVAQSMLERSQPIRLSRSTGEPGHATSTKRLLAVGSILHFARNGDTVWGTGVNGKIGKADYGFDSLDLRAVRGPVTAAWLADHKSLDVPEVYGDPGLLIGDIFPELVGATKTRRLSVIPNLNEMDRYRGHPDLVSPMAPLSRVLRAIAESEVVVGSSLHAVVVADSLGVPSALIRSQAEPSFKYDDYFMGTGRPDYETFSDVEKAIEAGESLARTIPISPLAAWDKAALLDAFPLDLWPGSN